MKNFRIVATASFERQWKKVFNADREADRLYVVALASLMHNPFGRGHLTGIKKLKGVESGGGQWRIRVGRYRLRNDIIGNTVVLHAIRDRKDAYH